MKHVLLIIFALSLMPGILAQTATSNAIVSITVTPPVVPATVTVVPGALSYHAGTTADVAVSVSGPSGVATGTVELLGKAPGQSVFSKISSFSLAAGKVTCTYPIPATAPAGTYSLEAAYCGNDYAKSSDCQ